jgi:hypothetical protein
VSGKQGALANSSTQCRELFSLHFHSLVPPFPPPPGSLHGACGAGGPEAGHTSGGTPGGPTRPRHHRTDLDIDTTAEVVDSAATLFQHNPQVAGFPPSNPLRGAMWKAASRRALLKRKSVAKTWGDILSAATVVGTGIVPGEDGVGCGGGGGGMCACVCVCM